jgi:hypothetical protein
MNVTIRTKRGTPVIWKPECRPSNPAWDNAEFFMAKGRNAWVMGQNGQTHMVWIGAIKTAS